MVTVKIAMTCIAALTIGCSSFKANSPVTESSEYLSVAGTNYRKVGAFKVNLLWVGYKNDHRFEPLFLPILPTDIQAHLTTEAFTDLTRKAAFDVGASAGNTVIKAGINAKNSLEQGSKGTYKVFVIQNTSDLVDALNSEENSKRIQDLRYYEDPRIIIGTATVFNQESKLDQSSEADVNLSIPKFAWAPELKMGGSQGLTSTVKLSDGTTFAYEFARMCFVESGDRFRVATLYPDRPSSSSPCPAGTYKSILAVQRDKDAQKELASRSR